MSLTVLCRTVSTSGMLARTSEMLFRGSAPFERCVIFNISNAMSEGIEVMTNVCPFSKWHATPISWNGSASEACMVNTSIFNTRRFKCFAPYFLSPFY